MPRRSPGGGRGWPRRSSTPTTAGSCTATSSRRTSWSPTTACRCSSISTSRRSPGSTIPRPHPPRSGGPSPTWRRNSSRRWPRGVPNGSTPAPISMPWASFFTSAWCGDRERSRCRPGSKNLTEALCSAAAAAAGQAPAGARRRIPTSPPAFEAVVARCLAPDPDDRYASASELAVDLQAVADDAPLRLRPRAARQPLRPLAPPQPPAAGAGRAAVPGAVGLRLRPGRRPDGRAPHDRGGRTPDPARGGIWSKTIIRTSPRAPSMTPPGSPPAGAGPTCGGSTTRPSRKAGAPATRRRSATRRTSCSRSGSACGSLCSVSAATPGSPVAWSRRRWGSSPSPTTPGGCGGRRSSSSTRARRDQLLERGQRAALPLGGRARPRPAG